MKIALILLLLLMIGAEAVEIDINPGDSITFLRYGGNETISEHSVIGWVKEGEPMWPGGPAAPFAGYITKGDHNEVIDQQAGQIFGMANISYLDAHASQIRILGNGISYDDRTGLVIYRLANGTFVGDGISYLTPVKPDWIKGWIKADT